MNDVGLYDLDGAGIDQSGEGVAPGFGLESCHGNTGPAGEFCTTRDILRQLGHSESDARRLLDTALQQKKKFKDEQELLQAIYTQSRA